MHGSATVAERSWIQSSWQTGLETSKTASLVESVQDLDTGIGAVSHLSQRMKFEEFSGPGRHSAESCPAEISILYVEDEPGIRDILLTILTRKARRLYVAENGEVGLTLYREHRPDIVITDIDMPVMNGIQMVEKIRLIDPEAVVIALTARSDTSCFLDAARAGVGTYVLKPVDLGKLFKAIAEGVETITTRTCP